MPVTQPDPVGATPGSETIEQLFAALESPLLAYAFRLTEATSVAEDLVQDAFMKLQAQFKDVREPKSWLYRTVHNLALNHQRQARKIIPLEPNSAAGAETADPRPLPDEQIVRFERIGLVRLTLEMLDERSREVVRLKFTENLSYKEISERTGLKTGHVGYLLHHALKSMADELARNGVVP
jgi:RNA polymerase sigma-70 factor (ECF subfamily)